MRGGLDVVTSGHWCRCDSSQLSSFVLDDMLIWAPVGGHWVKERQAEGKKPKPIIGGSCHKYNFCRDKTRLLSRQKYVCRDKITFAVTNICRDKRNFVATKILSDCRIKRRKVEDNNTT